MHSSSLWHRSAPWRVSARIVLFASLALAAAVPSQAARGGKNGGSPPVIAGTPPASVMVGQAYSFRPSASDPDGDRLSFRIRNQPAWARFDGSTGTLSGTPTSAGTYGNVEIRVTDGRNWASLPQFSITVAEPQQTNPVAPNSPPTISGTPASSATAGQVYAFRPTAMDANGDALTFGIQGKPSWVTFDSATGSLYGTPAATDVGVYPSIVISVSDGNASTSLPAFAITVVQAAAPANNAPTISGSPVSNARAGQPYAFRPTAADADGDPLRFNIQGRPSWATFDTVDGTLYGTPASTDVGVSSSIVISVSDGSASASLPAFSITVAPPPTSSARVSWQAPTSNVDGTPITDLTGFRVFYGNAAGQYSQSLLVSNPEITSVVIEGLALSTTWYFATKAVTAGGVESEYSQEVSKTL